MKKGFTLIELLIVIAIIAILALIAVPNFLEAQVRAKISRVHADMRTVAVGIKAYAVDWGREPIGRNEGQNGASTGYDLWDSAHRSWCLHVLTTPVAFLGSIPLDPFEDSPGTSANDQSAKYYEYNHYGWLTSAKMVYFYTSGHRWYLRSPGPARQTQPWATDMAYKKNPNGIYDATNGTLSEGQFHRTDKGYFDTNNW